MEVKGIIGCLSVVPTLFFPALLFSVALLESMREAHHTDGDVDPQFGIFCHCLGRKKKRNELE